MRPVILIWALVILCPALAQGAVPATMSYQGILADASGQPVPDDDYDLTFRIYTVAYGGTPLWEELNTISTVDGVFDAILGRATPLDLPFDQEYYLGITVAGEGEMGRVCLAASPYARRAAVADVGEDADWTIAGDDIHRLAGKVGIGTASPQAKLHLSDTGDLELLIAADSDNVDESDHALLTLSQDGGAVLARLGYNDVAGNYFTIMHEVSGDTVALMEFGRNGNIATDGDFAIGGGDANYDGAAEVLVLAGQADSWIVGAVNDPALENSDFFISTNISSDGTFHIANDGDIGIGTTAPEEKLDVRGTLQTTGLRVIGGPTAGYVLTCQDGVGTANWQPPGAFTLPYDGAVTSGSTAMTITNDGSGSAFHASRPDNNANVYLACASGGVVAYCNSGVAVEARHAANFRKVQLATEDYALYADGGALFENGDVTVPVLHITGGSDLSERFPVADGAGAPEPGMVVCIDPEHPGRLAVSCRAYDTCVAGVISGAGGVAPGMLMGQAGTLADGDNPVALSGRVYCHADAAAGPIAPGDLLTTSATPGHAMAARDRDRAQGAILGKAMTSLESGTGLVLVLVTLQ
jgi:hypothetical protein